MRLHFYEYDPYFQVGRKTQKDKAHQYVKGLFCAERSKRNLERMVEEVNESDYESLQHFISDSPWDTEGLMQHLAHSVSRDLQPLGLIGCTVDEKAGDTEAIEQTLVIRKPLRKKNRIKYSLSNIGVDHQSIETFAFMQAQRFWIEKCKDILCYPITMCAFCMPRR